MRLCLFLVFSFLVTPLYAAAPWEFGKAVNVSQVHGANIYHHLESAGRQHIAISGKYVAVVWEDNRDGVSRCYVALKSIEANDFSPEYRISADTEAFEPVIVGLHDGYFAVAWESDGKIWMRLLGPNGVGKLIVMTNQESMQANLAYDRTSGLHAAWAERDGRYLRLKVAKLKFDVKAVRLNAGAAYSVDSEPLRGDQLYPSMVALNGKGLAIAWEDRREGHTLIFHSYSADGKRFSKSMQLNEAKTGGFQGLGRGTGVMRVVVSRAGKEGVGAVWSDKRDFLAGYDVYAAYGPAGSGPFGANQKVQDSFGDNIAQWHPAIGGNNAGQIAVVWDDDRDGTSDVWLSWPLENGWSDNMAIPGASGSGVQVEPAIAMDEQGNVHIAWVDKPELNAPSRVRYVMGRDSGLTRLK